MSHSPTVFVATDFSPLSEIAHDAGFRLAKAIGARRVHFEHVVEGGQTAALRPYSFDDVVIERIYKERVQEAEAKLAAITSPDPEIEVTRRARMGTLGPGLIAAAEEVKADWIVVASHGYGAVKRAILGSAASALIRAAHAPVLVVGEGRAPRMPPKHILAAIDLSPVSRAILSRAFDLAAPGGDVLVLTMFDHPLVVASPDGMLPRYLERDEIDLAGQRLREKVLDLVAQIPHPGITVRVDTMSLAPAAQAILEVSSLIEPDLICVGTSGHSAWHRLMLGSTATRVLHEARYPVLVVPTTPGEGLGQHG